MIIWFKEFDENMKKERNKSIILAATLLFTSTISFFSNSFIQVSAKEYDVIDEHLQQVMEHVSADEKIRVSIWLRDIDHSVEENEIKKAIEQNVQQGFLPAKSFDVFQIGDNKKIEDFKEIDDSFSIEQKQLLIATKREVSSRLYSKNNLEVTHKIFSEEQAERITFFSHYSPNITIDLTTEEIKQISNQEEIEKIYFYSEPVFEDTSIDESIESNNFRNESVFTDYQYSTTGIAELRDSYGLTGAGVKIGILDSFFSSWSSVDYLDNNSIQYSYCESGAWVNSYSTHGMLILCLLAGNYHNSETGDSYLGAVPDAELYISGGYSYRTCFEALLDQGVNLITTSFAVAGDGYNTYGDDSKWIDHIVYQHNVSFICAAGNNADTGVLPMCFPLNGITVGSSNSTKARSSYSSYNNNDNSPIKPDVLAPGTNLIFPASRNNPEDTPTPTSGTSLAAPIVAGAVAQLCQASTVLATNPRLMKATILSGSEISNPMSSDGTYICSDTSTHEHWFSKKYGSGILNVKNSYLSYLNNFNMIDTMQPFLTQISFTKSITVSEGDIIRLCGVWDNKSTVSVNNHSQNATVLNTENYLLDLRTPSGSSYRVYNNFDSKNIVSINASESGVYKIYIVKET